MKGVGKKAVKRVIRPGSEVYPRIIEILEKVGGKSLETDLLDELRKRGMDLTLPELRHMLMKLEIRDKIRVLSLDRERKVVELIRTREITKI